MCESRVRSMAAQVLRRQRRPRATVLLVPVRFACMVNGLRLERAL